MARSMRALCFALLPYLPVGAVAACGSGHGDQAALPSDGGPDAEGAPQAPPPLAVSPPPTRDTTPSRSDAGLPPAVCVPKAGLDEPDDDFKDTNCDGIDGDASAAIFVAPTGSDLNAGTIDSPVRTLRRAIETATKSAKAVYVCSAEYAESVEFDRVGVSLYGGYDCTNGWKRRPDRAIVKPPSGLPLVVSGVSSPIVIEWLAFRAADAKTPGESSIAASVFDSTSVRFAHVEFTAGNGADGVDGGSPDAPFVAPIDAQRGEDVVDAQDCSTTGRGKGPQPSGGTGCAATPAGGRSALARCPDGAVIWGGPGGAGGNFALDMAPGEGLTGFPEGTDLDGHPGAAGKQGFGGSGFGKIEKGRYLATSGRRGWPGRPGAAGRGGRGGESTAGGGSPAARYLVGGGGGQGGFPGCGGFGGQPGSGGGASIAIIVDGSQMTLDRSLLVTGRGGRGGAGGDGSPGHTGATGGLFGFGSQSYANGMSGGHGGDGGDGGAGGPGGGGPSIGVVFRGAPPVITAANFSSGAPGAGGLSSAETAASGLGADTYWIDAPADAGK
jgi:hypothetical protein